MKAKEKAELLVNEFMKLQSTNGMVAKRNSKKCALIAVDEIINAERRISDVTGYSYYEDYWQKVKREIEKL